MDPISNPDGCKWHKSDGCERPKCPLCLVLPCLSILQKLANHVDLIKGGCCFGDPHPKQEAKRGREGEGHTGVHLFLSS